MFPENCKNVKKLKESIKGMASKVERDEGFEIVSYDSLSKYEPRNLYCESALASFITV